MFFAEQSGRAERRRYRKIEVDSRFSAVEDRGRYSVCSKTNVFYLLLSSSRSTSGRLQGKNSFYLHIYKASEAGEPEKLDRKVKSMAEIDTFSGKQS